MLGHKKVVIFLSYKFKDIVEIICSDEVLRLGLGLKAHICKFWS